METIGKVVSRIRNAIKAVKQDAFITDRFIYSLIIKHSGWILAREDSRMKIMGYYGIQQSLDYVELTEVDRVQAGCSGIKSGCTIKRTKNKLPGFFQGYAGPLITGVTSISGSRMDAMDEADLQPTTPADYGNIVKSSTFKYNKTRYYWFLNEYIFLPNTPWDAIKITGIGPGNFATHPCCGEDKIISCVRKQDEIMYIPEKLFGEIEAPVMKELGFTLSIQPDLTDDKQNILR